MRRYTIRPGKHDFFPPEIPWIRRKPTYLRWEVHFSVNSRYKLPGADQQDWNKGGGLSFNMLNNHKDSTMWSWRYNPELGLMELSTYSHLAGAISKGQDGEDKPVFTAPIGRDHPRTIIELKIDYTQNRYIWVFSAKNMTTAIVVVPFSHSKSWTKDLGLWFGGNQEAPKRIDIYLEKTNRNARKI